MKKSEWRLATKYRWYGAEMFKITSRGQHVKDHVRTLTAEEMQA